MTTITEHLGRRTGTTALIRSEGRLFVRERVTLFWLVGFPIVMVTVFGLIPSWHHHDPDLGGRRMIDLYVPVCVLLSMVTAIQIVPATLTSYRELGVLRRLGTTPASPASVLLAQLLLNATAILVSVVVVLAEARLAWDIPLPRSILGYVVAYVVALAAALALGCAVSAVSPTAKVGQVVGSIAFFVSMFCTGLWSPVQTMHGWLHDVVTRTPFGAASLALTDASGGSFPELTDLAITAGWAVVFFVIAVRFFRWE